MGWKTIKGRSYFYKSRRRDGRVVSEYLGPGAVGELFAELDRLDRVRRELARHDERERVRAMAAEDRRLARYCRGVQAIFIAAMEDAGYGQHDRGPWRKRRAIMSKPATAKKPRRATPTPAIDPRTMTRDQVQEVIDRAQDGDASALPALRAILRSDEWGGIVLEVAGSPSLHLEEVLIASVAGKDGLAIREAMARKADEVRKGLIPADAHPLEVLLAGRVTTCWLAVNVAEIKSVNRQASGREAEHLDRRVDRCHRRLLSAIRAFTAIRRPGAPGVAVQVNVTNAAGGDPVTILAGAGVPALDAETHQSDA